MNNAKKQRQAIEQERLEISSKKIGAIKGTFHAQMDTTKDRNGRDLAEAEEIKKRGDKNTQQNYTKKGVNDPDTHDDMVTHRELDTLECEVKWVSGSLTMNKALDVMEFQLTYLKSLKMMLLKCCTQYASKFGKLSSD